MRRRWIWLGGAVLLAAPASGQEPLADRVLAAPDGIVRMSFTARPGVCGNGENVWTQRRNNADWDVDCEPGPVHVALTTEAGEVIRIRVYVGGRWRVGSERTTDLGRVPAPEAAAYLLMLARTGSDPLAHRAIWPATLADSATLWPDLLVIARDPDRGRRVRRVALQNVGMAAAEAVPDDGGGAFPEDEREMREQAVFALSQLPDEQSVPMLLEIAREHRDAGLRRRALFWLGQSGDPRAITLFEEILRR